MSFKGLVAISLFGSSILLSNFLASSTPAFDWSHGLVVAGGTVKIDVHGSPCEPITVTLYVNGQTITGRIDGAPGSVTLTVPPGCEGQSYTIEIRCPDARTTASGQVS
jgi:hypothetical protein